MKFYVLLWWDYEGAQIYGFYSTKELAEEAKKEAMKNHNNHMPPWEIEEAELDRKWL